MFVSALTLVKLDRVLHRAVALDEITEQFRAGRRAKLAKTSRHWLTLELTRPIFERARSPFPGEPVRTLDALHLASAIEAQEAAGAVEMLSLDHRVRENAAVLGFGLVP